MSGERILIVEDEAIVARDIQSRLRALGYRADWIAVSGEEAVRFAREAGPQLVLMDMSLGDGIDGVETVSQIHATCETPIVFITGHSDEASIARAKIAAPYGYILKPVQTIELRVTIEIALHRHQLQTKLNETNRCLATTLASIGDGVISTDSNGVVKIVNRVAAAMLGREEVRLVGERIDSVFQVRSRQPSDATPLADPVTQLLASGEDRLTYSNVLLSGTSGVVPVDVTATVIRDDQHRTDGLVLVFRDITERQIAEEYMRHLAFHDNLTGLPNRALLHERMDAAIAQCLGRSRNLALLFLDLDGFKAVNDSLGHDAGDDLLRQLAVRLNRAVRSDDTVARLAGDEFIIILNGIAGHRDAEEVAAQILADLSRGFQLGEAFVNVTASIGIALFPEHGTEIEKLIRYADTAMYLAKQDGKNAYALYAADWKRELPAG